jgi:hypothetical protein
MLDTELKLLFSDSAVIVQLPTTEAAAREFVRSRLRQLAMWAKECGRARTEVVYSGCRRPFRVSASLATGSDDMEPISNAKAVLLGADYMQLLERLMTWRQEGRIVIITSNTTDICLHTNDLLKPSRAYWNANQFTGYNYLRSWRLSYDDESQLNPQYNQLKDLLARDGYVPGYRYELFRPDGAKCSYQTDYYLCRDYCGDEVRIGVSKVEDWSLLEPAPSA